MTYWLGALDRLSIRHLALGSPFADIRWDTLGNMELVRIGVRLLALTQRFDLVGSPFVESLNVSLDTSRWGPSFSPLLCLRPIHTYARHHDHYFLASFSPLSQIPLRLSLGYSTYIRIKLRFRLFILLLLLHLHRLLSRLFRLGSFLCPFLLPSLELTAVSAISQSSADLLEIISPVTSSLCKFASAAAGSDMVKRLIDI